MNNVVKLSAVEAPKTLLPVRTDFYRGGKVIKRIRAGSPINAIANGVKHMRRNEYEADTAEVYDLRDGKLYAVMRLSVDGNFRTVFEKTYSTKEESRSWMRKNAKTK